MDKDKVHCTLHREAVWAIVKAKFAVEGYMTSVAAALGLELIEVPNMPASMRAKWIAISEPRMDALIEQGGRVRWVGFGATLPKLYNHVAFRHPSYFAQLTFYLEHPAFPELSAGERVPELRVVVRCSATAPEEVWEVSGLESIVTNAAGDV